MNMTTAFRTRYGVDCDFDIHDTPTLRTILGRRSRREFGPEPVDPALVKTLFAVAFSAPSKSDLQQATVIRVTDRGRLERISRLNDRVGWIAGAPEFMIWCGDGRRIRRLSESRGHPFANDHLDSFMNAAVDAAIVMQTFILAAESAGLGCCPVSEIRDSIEPLSAELALPDHVFPVAGLCVGWPRDDGVVSMRLPNAVTVMENRYDDADLLPLVEAYDRRRERLQPTPRERQRRTDLFGTADVYGWSEHRTRQYALPMRADFGAFVRGKKFDLS